MVHLTDRFKLFLNYFDCTLIVILFRNQLLCDPVPCICLNALSNITLQQAFEIPEHRIIQIYLCFAISVNKPLHIKFITITDLASNGFTFAHFNDNVLGPKFIFRFIVDNDLVFTWLQVRSIHKDLTFNIVEDSGDFFSWQIVFLLEFLVNLGWQIHK